MSTITEVPSGVTGAIVYEVIGAERLVYDNLRMVFDPSKLYRVRVRMRQTARPTAGLGNLVRIGVEGVAADERTLVGTDGSLTVEGQYFVAADDVDMVGYTLDEWVVFTGYLKGQGAYVAGPTSLAAPSGMDSTVAYIQPVVWVNMTDGDGTVQVGEIILDVLPEDATQMSVGSITVNQALASDPALVDDLSYAGRVAYLPVSNIMSSYFGRVLGMSLTGQAAGELAPANPRTIGFRGMLVLDLGLGAGDSQPVLLPGALVRNDSLSLVPGLDIYLYGSNGGITQVEPSLALPKIVVGKALASNMWYFDPQASSSLDEDARFSCQPIATPETPYSAIEWDGNLYVGCDAKIYRSDDWGVTWDLVHSVSLGSGYYNAIIRAFAVMGSSLFAVVDKHTDADGCQCLRTTDGTTWTTAAICADPIAMDLIELPSSSYTSLVVGTAVDSGYGKIYTSSDGITWTLRYTSSANPCVARFTAASSVVHAFEGYPYWMGYTPAATNKHLSASLDGTTWTVRANYTTFDYLVGNCGSRYGTTSYYSVVDFAYPNRLYGFFGVTGGTNAKLEANPSDWIEGYGVFVFDGAWYAIGTTADYSLQIYKRNPSYDGTTNASTWELVQQESNLQIDKFFTGTNGHYYFTVVTGGLYRMSRKNSLLS